jgi:hypothetical protein
MFDTSQCVDPFASSNALAVRFSAVLKGSRLLLQSDVDVTAWTKGEVFISAQDSDESFNLRYSA